MKFSKDPKWASEFGFVNFFNPSLYENLTDVKIQVILFTLMVSQNSLNESLSVLQKITRRKLVCKKAFLTFFMVTYQSS